MNHSLSTAALAPDILVASWMDTGLCTRPQWKLSHIPFSAMWSICCRFTHPHAPVFSESDCSSLASIEVFWISVGLPSTHLYPSGSLVRRIWNLVVPVHSSERLTPFAPVHMSLIIFSKTLFILVWVCFFTSTYFKAIGSVSVVKLQTRIFTMSINKFSTHGPRIFCVASLIVAFFDFNFIFLLQVSLCCRWRSWTFFYEYLVAFWIFWRRFLRLLILANLKKPAIIKSPDRPPPRKGQSPRISISNLMCYWLAFSR